jgi:hypothetical protein
MSGHKCTEIELDAELVERLALVRSLDVHHGAVCGLVKRLRETLDQASDGLKSSFAADVNRVEEFLSATQIPEIQQFDARSPKTTLLAICRQVSALARQAAELQEKLDHLLGQAAERQTRELITRLADLSRLYAGHRELLQAWCPADELAAWDQVLAAVNTQLAHEQLHEARQHLVQLEAELPVKIQRALDLAAQQQKRLYVLNAINSVCQARGFRRVSGPDYEQPEDPASALVMVFDTLDHGLIDFRLTLQGIHTNSELGEGRCFEEFDALSESLRTMYGVKTEFRRAADGSRPNLQTARGVGQESERRTVSRTQSLRKST